MSLADKTDGRCISLSFWVRLTPTRVDVIGETDAAELIGRGLVREAMLMLINAGEAEGFVVDVQARQINY